MDANLLWQRSIITGQYQYQCQRQCQSRGKISSVNSVVPYRCSMSLFQVIVPSVFMANTVIFGANTMVLRQKCFFWQVQWYLKQV